MRRFEGYERPLGSGRPGRPARRAGLFFTALLTAALEEHIVNKPCFDAWRFVGVVRGAGSDAGRRGRTWPRRQRHGGAPGGAAPLRHWGARAVATARGGPRH